MRYYLLLVLCFGLIITSCKSTKKATTTVDTKESRLEKEIYASLENHNFDFEWFEFKGTIDADLPTMGASGTLYLRMKKGEKIWFSAKKFGFEGLRGLITPNEATVINRLERVYMQENPNDFVSQLPYPLSFEELQMILSGQIINLTDKSSIIRFSDKTASILTDIKGNKMEYVVDLATLKVQKIIAIGDERLEITYGDYKEMGEYGTHPTKIKVYFTQKGRQGTINLKSKKITVDIEKRMPFSVPSRYQKVRF